MSSWPSTALELYGPSAIMRAMGAWFRSPRPIRVACAAFGAVLSAQGPSATADSAADLVRQGQAKQREGKPAEALALYRQAVQASPKSFAPHHQLGMLLDVTGEYNSARKHLL